MKILVIDNNELDFTKVENIYTNDSVKILNVKSTDNISERMNKELDINLIIINEVLTDVKKRHLLYKKINQYCCKIPIVSLILA